MKIELAGEEVEVCIRALERYEDALFDEMRQQTTIEHGALIRDEIAARMVWAHSVREKIFRATGG